MTENLAVSFVVPVLGETDSLETTVETIVRLAAGHLHEVLVVTSDRTLPESIQAVGQLQQAHGDVVRVHRQQLPGLGGALREAFALAGGSHIMLMASDLETDPELIPRFIEVMQQGDCDVVCGSRWLGGGGFEGYGRCRVVLNRLFQQGLKLLYPAGLTDLTYAYRLYRRDALEGIVWQELGHPFLLECLLKPLRLGARAVEVPCRWRRRREGASSGSLGQMLRYLPLAVRVRLQSREKIRRDTSVHLDVPRHKEE